jgi:hypothetical protein
MKLYVTAKVRKANGNLGATVLDQVFRFMRRLTRHFEEFNVICDNPQEDTPAQAEYRRDVHTWLNELEAIEAALKAEQVSENPSSEKIKALADKLAAVRSEASQIAAQDPILGKMWNQVFQKVSSKKKWTAEFHTASKKKPAKRKISQ